MHVESVDAEASLVAASIAFERAGRGLALLAGDGRILRLNAAFAALHDSDPAALLHRPISDPLPGYEPAENVDTTVVLTDPAAELFLRRTAIGTDSVLRYRLTALPGTGESSGNAQLLAEVWLDRGPQLAKGPIAEALVEADSTIVAANPAMQRLLARADTLVGQRLTHLAHPDDVAELRQVLRAPVRGTGIVAATIRFSLPDGSTRFLHLVGSGDDNTAGADADDNTAGAGSGNGPRRLAATDETRQRQDALLLSETFETAPRPFVMVDAAGRLLGANSAWIRQFAPLERLPQDLSSVVDPQGCLDLHGQLQRVAHGIVAWFDVHAVANDADGQPVAVCVSGTALHDLDGRLEQVLLNFTDETDRALEVEISRGNAVQTRQLLDQLDGAVVVHDRNGRITDVNLGAHRLFGSMATDLLGRHGLPEWWNPTDTDGHALTEAEQPAALLRGDGPSADTLVSIRLPGESTRWFAARARPVERGGPAGRGTLTTYFEVTSLQEGIEAANRRTGQIDRAFAALPVAAYLTDERFVITETNDAWGRLLGHPASPTSLLSLADPSDRHLLAEAAAQVEREGAASLVQHRIRRADGSIGWVQHRLGPRASNDEFSPLDGYCGVIIPIPGWVANSERTKRLVHLVETTNDLVAEFDLSTGHISYLNPRARQLLGVEGELGDVDIWTLYLPEVKALFRSAIWPALRREGRWQGELAMHGVADRIVSVQHAVSAEKDGDRIVRLVVTGQDMTERSHRDQELALAATHDALTGLANRQLMLDHLDSALVRARRQGHLVALIITDLDRFKSLNDTIGSPSGDRILHAVADRLHRAVRPGDLVGRLGGDEFAVICEAVDGRQQAGELATRFVAGITDRPYFTGRKQSQLRASVGVALSDGADHAETVLRDAEAALYRAKEFGGGRVELFDETMRSLANTRGQLAEELRAAVNQGEIVVYYQPCIDLRNGRVRSVEALVRWRHPERGLLAPGEFIDVADASGLISALGLEVLRLACQRASLWQRRWGAAAPRMNVNLSIRQMADPHLVDQVAAVLADSGLAAEALCLELIESTLLDDAEGSIGVVNALRALGVGLAIDDFGTGYSSLSYLSRLPVDLVKVDKSFVDRLDPAGDGSVVAAAIVSLAHALGLSTIAEGVTTVEQLAELHRIGCDAAQGYFFSEPLTSDGIDEYVARKLAEGT